MTHFMGLNPWLSMWNQPRITIRAIVSSEPYYGTFWLPTVYALQSLFFGANWQSLGLYVSFQSILLTAFLLAPVVGAFWLYSLGAALCLGARLLGGSAPYSHVRSALAWSHIPSFIGLVLWFVLLFNQTDTTFVLSLGETPTLFVIFISLVSMIWVVVLMIRSFAEIQGFSILKSILNIIIGMSIYFSFLFSISFIYSYIFAK